MNRFIRLFLNLIPRPILIRLSFLFRPFLSFWYKGNTFTDPIDGKSFRQLLPYGYVIQRENVLSPSTLSLERHRLLWLYLQRETSFFTSPLSLLHFAPEQCFYKRFRSLDHVDYTTTDLHSPIADVKADICNLPFEDDGFDFILCNHVLEHIPDDVKAMSEIYRVLRPGGTAVLQIPLDMSRTETFADDSIKDPVERARVFGQYDHVRVYGMDYFDRLKEVGFVVEAVDFTKSLSPEEVHRYALAPGELIPVVTKPV